MHQYCRPFYFTMEVALAIFMIVFCTNSIEFVTASAADRINIIMASLLIVVAFKYSTSDMIPKKSTLCLAERYFLFAFAYHVLFVLFVIVDEHWTADDGSATGDVTFEQHWMCFGEESNVRCYGDYFMLMLWLGPHVGMAIFPERLLGCKSVWSNVKQHDEYDTWDAVWEKQLHLMHDAMREKFTFATRAVSVE